MEREGTNFVGRPGLDEEDLEYKSERARYLRYRILSISITITAILLFVVLMSYFVESNFIIGDGEFRGKAPGNFFQQRPDLGSENKGVLDDKTTDQGTEISEVSTKSVDESSFSENSLEYKILACFESFEAGCKETFKNSGIINACENLGELSDQCIYDAALINLNRGYCEKLSGESSKQECRMDVSLAV